MTGILIAGTSSDAGKSLFVAGLCRALARRGLKVAPFKAQNMSNNSVVCADGSEIARSQYLQAQAAGIEPSSLLNPVLLKPGSDRTSQVIVRGRPAGTLEAGEYATGRSHLAETAFAAYRELAAEYDVVVVEGAGSPAEVNLRERDYVNMGLAAEFDLPVVVVGDVDRGGVLASVFGTWGILAAADRRRLAGYVINKFRGDRSVLEPGLADVTRRTGLPCLGVLPWLDGVWLDSEDALEVARWGAASADAATLLAGVAERAGRDWTPTPHPTHAEAREAMLDRLADAIDEHVDVEALLDLMPPTHQVRNDTDDTTRARRRQPRLIVNTGHGKGKSSSAFGTGLRGWAQGWSIGVFQFLKSEKWRTGERAAYEALAAHHAATGEGGPIEWHTMGAGWTWLRSTADVDQAELARQGWAEVARRLAAETHDLYILDEFTYALARGWVDLDEVLATLAARPGMQHVIITGRDAPPALLDAADLVTEMDKVKHPFDTGARGQAGIEW